MKYLRLFSLSALVLIVACETSPIESNVSEQTLLYTYNVNQQFSNTQSYIIDFEEFNTGDIVSEISIVDPFQNIQSAGVTMAFPDNNAAMIFDSSNPSGGDFDLGTPNEAYGGPGIGNGGVSNDVAMGNVLILSEDLDSSDPDDIIEIGAHFIFDFTANDNVTLIAFDILDIEASSNPTTVVLYDADENILLSKEITAGGDNSKSTVDLENTAGVAYMEITMNNSGAIDNIALEIETQDACVACDGDIAELTFMFNGFIPEASIRIETTNGDVIFDDILQAYDEFTIIGNNPDGTFNGELIIYVDNEQVDVLATDCTEVIGPGLFIQGLEILSGFTITGGQLCPVEVSIG